ncbi:MAG: hypothetical protein R8G66_24835 [Cytophagales bacterium]|nr:hypothetical protein [Cytophagales bacterium]
MQHKDDRVRFWVLDTLIKDHLEVLRNQTEMLPLLVPLLSDASGPVVDRTVWAINCTGSGAIPYLLEQIEGADISLKRGLFWAITKNFEAQEYLEEILTVFVPYMEHAQLSKMAFNCVFILIEEKVKRKQPLPVHLAQIRRQARSNLEQVLNDCRDEFWKARYRRVFEEEN